MIGNGSSGGNGKSPGWDDDDDPFPGQPWGKQPWQHAGETFQKIDLLTTAIPSYQRLWLIPGWIPMHETIGLGGPGGEGKTILACMLATAAARGATWLGQPVTQTKSALILCEDRPNDVLWRQAGINSLYQCTLSDLAPWLLICPRRDCEHNYLAIFDRDGELHETTFFFQLLDELKRFANGDQLLTVLDTRADVFWGNQNDERHARMFVRRICDRIARETNGVVLLVFQPSLAGMREGTGTSGSVQWHAAFRAFLYLQSSTEDDPQSRSLTLMKANHAEKDQSLSIRWNDGVFVLQEEFETLKPAHEIAAETGAFKDLFRTGFTVYEKRGQPLSANDHSPNFAPKKIAAMLRLDSKAKLPPRLFPGLVQAMNALIADGELHSQETVRHTALLKRQQPSSP